MPLTTRHNEQPIPYGLKFKLTEPLRDVECWNFITDSTFTLPAGSTIELCSVSDSKHTTVRLLDETGECNGVELTYMSRGQLVKQRGYRFIINNKVLGEAMSMTFPETTEDIVGDIIAYENGEATPEQEAKLLANPICRHLQGHYSSRCTAP